MAADLLEVLDAWELLDDSVAPSHYKMVDWRKISDAVEKCYVDHPAPILGSAHLGLFRGIRLAEGDEPSSQLALPLVSAASVWLPDPVYTLLTRTAARAWRLLPESGSHFFAEHGIRTGWEGLWTVPVDRRRAVLAQKLPQVLRRVGELRPLLESGAIRFFAWEPLVLEAEQDLRSTVRSLASTEIVNQITQRYTQDKYNSGVRVGPIGIEASHDFPDGSVKKGEPMWFGDKAPVVLSAILNARVSMQTGSMFLSDLPGDRVVYECIRTGGAASPTSQPIVSSLKIPALENGLWADIVAIRDSSESLAVLRAVLRDAAEIGDERALGPIRERLAEAAAKIREDSSIWRVARGATTDLAISTFIGASCGLASGNPLLGFAALGITGVAQLLGKLALAAYNADRQTSAQTSELLFRITSKL